MSLLKSIEEVKAATKGDHTKLRQRSPLVVQGVSKPVPMLVGVDKFHLLDIDSRYQRDRVRPEVSDLIAALQAGGSVPAPICLVRRKYKENGRVSELLWVVDGQQRAWAHLWLKRPFNALVYEVDSLDHERDLFVALNTFVSLSAKQHVESASGAAAAMIREVSADAAHPLHGLIAFRNGGGGIASSSVARGIFAAMLGRPSNGRIQDILRTCDAAMGDRRSEERARAFLQIIPGVFPSGAKTLPLSAVGLVAYRRWQDGVVLPSKAILSRVRRINWDHFAPSPSLRWMPTILKQVEQAWKK
jgi:hypothetical protein